jgi:hypothetical protein
VVREPPVGLRVQDGGFHSEPLDQPGEDAPGRPVRDVDDHPLGGLLHRPAVRPASLPRALCDERDVVVQTVDLGERPLGHLLGSRDTRDDGFHAVETLLVAYRAAGPVIDLAPVVLPRIVGSGHHDAGLEPPADLGEVKLGRARKADPRRLPSFVDESRGDGPVERGRVLACVVPDQPSVGRKVTGECPADPVEEHLVDLLPVDAPDVVGLEHAHAVGLPFVEVSVVVPHALSRKCMPGTRSRCMMTPLRRRSNRSSCYASARLTDDHAGGNLRSPPVVCTGTSRKGAFSAA